MKVFVVNCGSSSVKYQLFSMTRENVLAKGFLERIGTPEAELHHTAGNERFDMTVDAPDHTASLEIIIRALLDRKMGVIKDIGEIQAVGHRVVHGGEQATKSALIDDGMLCVIRRNAELAPLHNPPNLSGIEAARKAMPNVPHVAVFDTAFLATLPPKAYRYAVPDEWYTKHHVRRYGFHGTSHRWVTLQAADVFNKPVEKLNLITCHLGNGCSMTAVANGKAVDHSMGMTPLEGLVMGTRSGDVDPAIVTFMVSHGMSVEQVDRELNKKSGLLGLSKLSNDMRDLLIARDEGDKAAELAVDVFVYRLVKYIGAYATVLPELDGIIMTGGIGENSFPVRAMVCRQLHRLGIDIDEDRNQKTIRGQAGRISTDGSKIPVWVIPTNEELMIARDAQAIASGQAS